MKEASFWERRDEKSLHCFLCRHNCIIAEGKRGICGVRENRDGTLYSLVYGVPCTNHVDPIEKKPLFHFYPGTKAFSIATVGCNFRCLHCQNHDIQGIFKENRRLGIRVGNAGAPGIFRFLDNIFRRHVLPEDPF